MKPPFEILNVCWPQPAHYAANHWTSAPAWDAPSMDTVPALKLRILEGLVTWSVDWRDFFRTGVRTHDPWVAGEMRGFHVVFRISIYQSGTLEFWDDDGSIVRRNGEIVHEDRSAHALTPHSIPVAEGDILEFAQWQLGWGWMWCGLLHVPGQPDASPEDEFLALLPAVRQMLHSPTGPPLKLYTSASHPLRLAAAVYSMVLNGYTPSEVLLYGQEQWSAQSRGVIGRLLPFATVVPQADLWQSIRNTGGAPLVELARRHWFVAKTFVALSAPPQQACLMDDDIFILGPVADAVAASTRCDLVYAPDQDLSGGFLRLWQRLLPCPEPLPTGRFNAGLYWIRNIPPARLIASAALRCPVNPSLPFLWEQGLIAMLYAQRPTCELDGRRYNFPLFDGLPGGVYGYDYRTNPCGFAAIHYGGLAEKPSDDLAVQLIAAIAALRTNVPAATEVSV